MNELEPVMLARAGLIRRGETLRRAAPRTPAAGLVPAPDPAAPADPRPVLFLHIPKTAGTSFLTTLQNIFGERQVLRLAMEEQGVRARIAEVAKGARPEVACLNGHLPVDMFAGLLDRFRPFTILRDPIARVFSLFRFQRRNPNIEALGLPRNFSFEQFLEARAADIYAQATNGMCRMLAGDPAFTNPGAPAYAEVDRHPELIGRAVELLEKIDFGLAEDMAGTHAIIENRWNVPFALDEMMLNTTERDDVHRNWRHVYEVAARNVLDIALYERAREIFRERLARLADTPRPPAAAARMLFRPQPGAWTPLPAVPGRQGFHGWEPSGIAWINEGPPARIHFVAPAAGARIALRVFGVGTGYPCALVQLRLNGALLPFRVTEADGAWCTLEAQPAALAEGCINTLSIAAPRFIPVRSLDPSSIDRRSLAIALAGVRFAV